MGNNLEKKIKGIIAEKLKLSVEEIRDDAAFIDDLGADSLDIVEMVMSIEEEFNISVPDEDLDSIRTVSDAINYVRNKIG